MAVNFRLAYNNGLDYTDLFPKTNFQGVSGAENILSYETMTVTIPAIAEGTTTQTIDITTTEEQVNALVDMYLNTTGGTSENDYASITQYQVLTNQLVITRLYTCPTNDIEVTLVFKIKGAK